MTLTQINLLVGILASAATVMTFIITIVLIPVLRRVWKMLRGWDSFMRDWNGEPAQPGRDAAPGVMDRLNNLDGEFKRNHGSTLKDAVVRIEESIEDPDTGIKQHLIKMDKRLDNVEAYQTANPYPRKAARPA
jgi:hypothetical protein